MNKLIATAHEKKTEKWRIVHVLHSFSIGGMEKGVATIVSNTSSSFVHSIVCLARSGASQHLLPPKTEVVELKKSRGNSLLFIWKIARVLRSLRPHVVHTRNWSGIDAIIAAKLAGIRSVVHGEHGWTMVDPEGLKRRTMFARRIVSRWVAEYTCVSKQMRNWLVNHIGVKKPVTQIYNGVDSQKYQSVIEPHQKRASLGLSKDNFLVAIVGRLDPIKDHETLLKAFEAVYGIRSDAQLIVVGDGPEKKRLKNLAGEGVVFWGNRSDVPDILQAIDVFVLSSLNEGISNTILEAMATALPVVATRAGGNAELVEDGRTGLLVEPGDSTSMASAILRYAEEPDLRAEHGSAGRARVLEKFDVRKMVQSYEAVYRRVGKAKAMEYVARRQETEGSRLELEDSNQ